MKDLVDRSTSQRRFLMLLLTSFALARCYWPQWDL